MHQIWLFGLLIEGPASSLDLSEFSGVGVWLEDGLQPETDISYSILVSIAYTNMTVVSPSSFG